jgi:hypothetical protein
MPAEIDRTDGQMVRDFVERVSAAGDEPAARAAYREGFQALRSRIQMYPVPGRHASGVFESAARTLRTLAAACLPLGIAVAMHLYPLCVLQCLPLPRLSVARFQRAMFLRTIRRRSLIVANTGSERTRGVNDTLVARQDREGIRLDGTFEYMSLATVADIVLLKAQLADRTRTALCAADLRGGSVRIGGWKFSDSMRLSDTSSVTFTGHRIPHGRYVLVANDDVLRCIADYQRCWFHLFLAEIHLARLERLHQAWGIRTSAERIVSLNELSQLRAYALRLLDEHSPGAGLQALQQATSALKLRVSLMAQSTMSSLRAREDVVPADARQLRADAGELRFIRSQPTADEIILRSIGVAQAS